MPVKISAARAQQKSVANLDGNEIKEIPIGKIEEREDNLYLNGYEEEVINSITDNYIKELDNIIVEPIIEAGKASGRYRIVSGHQRFKAEQRLKHKAVTCKVITFDNEVESLEAAILANLHRKDDPIHLARRIRTYEENVYPVKQKETQTPLVKKEYIAKVFGISGSQYIRLRGLLKLDESVQNLVERKIITVNSAGKLNNYSFDEQKKFTEMVYQYLEKQKDDELADGKLTDAQVELILVQLTANDAASVRQKRVAEFNKVVLKHNRALELELKKDFKDFTMEEKSASIDALHKLQDTIKKALEKLESN